MVDNIDNHFKFFAPMTTSQVLMPNTLTQSYMLLRRKSGIMLKCLEHESNRHVFADLLNKGLPPSAFKGHTVDMGLWYSLRFPDN